MEFEMKSIIPEVSEKCNNKCSECTECGNTDSAKITVNSTSIDPSNLVVLAYRNLGYRGMYNGRVYWRDIKGPHSG